MPPLTKRLIDTTPLPATTDITLWDSKISGFGCRIHPTGRKVFFVRYRHAGIQRRLALGPYGVLTVEQARRLAQAALVAVLHGTDPATAAQASATVRTLAERYLREHATVKKKPKSAHGDAVILRQHVLPALGTHQVSRVITDDLATIHHAMRATPIQANRMLGLCTLMFRLAEQWDMRPRGSNPAQGIQRYRERSRERSLSLEEIARLGALLRDKEAKQLLRPSVVACIRLLLLTGCRLGEVLTLQWPQVHLDRGVLRLADSKTGPRTVYLSQEARQILEGLATTRVSNWVLPGHQKGHRLKSIANAWRRLRTAAGFPDVRVHDLRHTWATYALHQRVPLPLIAAAMGHTKIATTLRYTAVDTAQVAAAVQQVSTPLATALAGQQDPQGRSDTAYGAQRKS